MNEFAEPLKPTCVFYIVIDKCGACGRDQDDTTYYLRLGGSERALLELVGFNPEPQGVFNGVSTSFLLKHTHQVAVNLAGDPINLIPIATDNRISYQELLMELVDFNDDLKKYPDAKVIAR